jgi:hypothetical protein
MVQNILLFDRPAGLFDRRMGSFAASDSQTQ